MGLVDWGAQLGGTQPFGAITPDSTGGTGAGGGLGDTPGGTVPIGNPGAGPTTGNSAGATGVFGGFSDGGQFPGSSNNRDTGASRQIGEFGGYPVGQVDVRTPLMRMLEAGAAPLLMTLLTNPGSVASLLGGMAGPMPSLAPSGLSQMIFGGGGVAPGGAPPATQPLPAQGMQNVQQPQQQPMQPSAPQPQQGGAPAMTGSGNAAMPIAANMTGTMLGGGQVPVNVAGRQTDPTQLLASFGLAPGSVGTTGLIPGTGAVGQELNAGALNSALNPQGWLLGVRAPSYNSGTNSFDRMMTLFGPGGQQQNYAQDASGVNALQSFLTQQGVQFRAGGGPLDPYAPTVVGEQGPELITPALGGQQQVMPLTQPMPTLMAPPAAPMAQPTAPTAAPTATPPTQSMITPPTQGAAFTPAAPQLPSLPQLPSQTGMQASSGGLLGNLLQNNPEAEAYGMAKTGLGAPGGALSGGQGIVDALRPVWQQNLRFGINELTNSLPSVAGSAAALQGNNLAARSLNDFNLFAQQAMQQGQQNQLAGYQTLGGLAGQLSTQRDLGLGQLGLQAQQQQWNQTVSPMLQLLMAAMGMATPTAYQTVVPGKK